MLWGFSLLKKGFTSKVWLWSMCFLARGTRPEETKMDICNGSKCSHRKAKGSPSCPWSVPSLLSDATLALYNYFGPNKWSLFCVIFTFSHTLIIKLFPNKLMWHIQGNLPVWVGEFCRKWKGYDSRGDWRVSEITLNYRLATFRNSLLKIYL